MRYAVILLGIVALLGIGAVFVYGYSSQESTSMLIKEPLDVVWKSSYPAAPFIVGSAKGLMTQDKAKRWKRASGMRKANVYDMAQSNGAIFAATSQGLYASKDGGIQWQLIYRGRAEDGELLAISCSLDASLVVIGTEQKLLISRDEGKTWVEAGVANPKSAVSGLLCHPTQPAVLFAALESGLYRSGDAGRGWQRVLVQADEALVSDFEESSVEEVPENIEESLSARERQTIVAHPSNPQLLYAALRKGLFQSNDLGLSWQPVPSSGITGLRIHHLTIVPSQIEELYAATSAGVYRYSGQWRAWRMLEGSPKCDVRFLIWDETSRSFWAATEEGLIQLPLPADARLAQDIVSNLQYPISSEPTIAEVHQAAIRYAEVAPAKIKGWRTRARLAPWIPSFTLGIDRDRDTTIGSSSSGGRTNFTVGPEDRSTSVDFGFTWHLSELVWNPDQTSIDTRSRLMVQLRQDILDDVTRIYYERKRLQIEYQLQPVEDPVLQAERQLRIEELSAQLDALTGGQFTSLKEKKS